MLISYIWKELFLEDLSYILQVYTRRIRHWIYLVLVFSFWKNQNKYHVHIRKIREKMSWAHQWTIFLAGEDWKATWKNRLEKAGQAWTKKWTEHQTYDDYWKHGCICEDYDRIKIPILAIGGWHDMYSNAVFRMVEKMPNCRYV